MKRHPSPSSVPFPGSHRGISPGAAATCRGRDDAHASAEPSSAHLSPALGTGSCTELAESRGKTARGLGRCSRLEDPRVSGASRHTAGRRKGQRFPHPGPRRRSHQEFSSPSPQEERRTAKGGGDESGHEQPGLKGFGRDNWE